MPRPVSSTPIRYVNGYPVYGGVYGGPGNRQTYQSEVGNPSGAANAGPFPGYNLYPGQNGPTNAMPPDSFGGDPGGAQMGGYGFSPSGPYFPGIDPSGPAFANPFDPGFAYTGPGYQLFGPASGASGGMGYEPGNPFGGATAGGDITSSSSTSVAGGPTIDVPGGPWTPPANLPGTGDTPTASGGAGYNPFAGSDASGGMYNYYDAGNGITYVYDENWNYVGTRTAPVQQAASGNSGVNPFAGSNASGGFNGPSSMPWYAGAGPYAGGNTNPNNPGYVAPGVGPQPNPESTLAPNAAMSWGLWPGPISAKNI